MLQITSCDAGGQPHLFEAEVGTTKRGQRRRDAVLQRVISRLRAAPLGRGRVGPHRKSPREHPRRLARFVSTSNRRKIPWYRHFYYPRYRHCPSCPNFDNRSPPPLDSKRAHRFSNARPARCEVRWRQTRRGHHRRAQPCAPYSQRWRPATLPKRSARAKTNDSMRGTLFASRQSLNNRAPGTIAATATTGKVKSAISRNLRFIIHQLSGFNFPARCALIRRATPRFRHHSARANRRADSGCRRSRLWANWAPPNV